MKKNKWIILLSTLVVFSGYHYSKDKMAASSKLIVSKPKSDVSMSLNNNEATIKDWDRLFKKIIDLRG